MKSKIAVILVGSVALSLTGCAERKPRPKGPLPTSLSKIGPIDTVYVATKNASAPYLGSRVSKAPNNGPHRGNPVRVKLIGPDKGRNRLAVFLAPTNVDLIDQVANNFGPQLSPKLAFDAGKQIASQTVCQGKTITENKFGRSYSNPTDLSKVASQGGGILGAKVPKDAKGTRLEAAKFEFNSWEISLWCR